MSLVITTGHQKYRPYSFKNWLYEPSYGPGCTWKIL